MPPLYQGYEILRVRRGLRMNQTRFASLFNVSLRTVIRWEHEGAGWGHSAFDVSLFRRLDDQVARRL